jgi:hypothetical protein
VTTPAHGDPFALGDEYAYHQQQSHSSNDKWQQLHADLRGDIAFRKHMRDAQVEGDDLYTEYQNEITFMTRQLLALEANFDQLRDAQTAVSRARSYHNACRDAEKAFGRRCGTWRNAVGGVGAVALILCCTLDDVPGFIILAAVLGPLAAAGLHALGVMGGGGRATKADRADIEWSARVAELQYLEEQVLQGVRNPQPPGSQRKARVQSPAVSLFPEQHANSHSTSAGADQSATTQPIAQ